MSFYILILIQILIYVLSVESNISSSRNVFIGDSQWRIPANAKFTIRPISNSSECLTVVGSLSTIILKTTPCGEVGPHARFSNHTALSQCFVFIPRTKNSFRISTCLNPHVSVVTPHAESLTNRIANRAQVSLMDWEDFREQRWTMENVHPCAAERYGVVDPSIHDSVELYSPTGTECSDLQRPSFQDSPSAFSRWRKFVAGVERFWRRRPQLNKTSAHSNCTCGGVCLSERNGANSSVTCPNTLHRAKRDLKRPPFANTSNAAPPNTGKHACHCGGANTTALKTPTERVNCDCSSRHDASTGKNATSKPKPTPEKTRMWIVRFNNERKLVPILAPIGQYIMLLNERPAFKMFNAYLCWTSLTTFSPLSTHYITKICKGEPRPDKIATERPRKAIWNWDGREENRNKGRSLWLLQLLENTQP